MHNNPGSWMETLAKCNLLQYSTVKEKGDGHVSITITVLTDTEPKPCDEKSKEAASKILSLCEISAIWLTDNGGIALTSRYDGCTITINGIGLHYSHEENLDYEYAELDRRLSEISWTGGVPKISLYDFLEEVVGGDLASVFLRYCSPEVCLYRIYYPEEYQRHFSRMITKYDYQLWDNSNPTWALVPRKG